VFISLGRACCSSNDTVPDRERELLFYVQLLKEFMQEVYPTVLPMTEEISSIFFYGLMGKKED